MAAAMDFENFFYAVVNNAESSLLGDIETRMKDQYDSNCIDLNGVSTSIQKLS